MKTHHTRRSWLRASVAAMLAVTGALSIATVAPSAGAPTVDEAPHSWIATAFPTGQAGFAHAASEHR